MTVVPIRGVGVKRRNLADDVAEYIRAEIRSGRLRSGERIDQDAIAAHLGVSRLPVREALIALDQEGLVVTVPRKGSYVQQLERDEILDHYAIFAQVAGLAAARAVARMDDAQLDALIGIHEVMHRTKDVAELERLNHTFHRLINTACGSQRIVSMLKLLSRSLPMPYVDFPEKWLDDADRQHQAIVDALRKRDTLAAQRAMEQHINASALHAVDVLDQMGFFGDRAEGQS